MTRSRIDDAPVVEVQSRAQWRAWLADNHASHPPIWLVVHKKHVPDRYVSWGEIVREAICFGWIDSRSRRVDADRTSVYVAPRKTGSMWSALNKSIIAELEREGLLMPAGRALIERAKADGSWTFLDDVEALEVPPDLVELLTTRALMPAWEASSASARKRALLEVKTAKTDRTRRRRIERVAQRLGEGLPPS